MLQENLTCTTRKLAFRLCLSYAHGTMLGALHPSSKSPAYRTILEASWGRGPPTCHGIMPALRTLAS
jgi:hypothetical protein